MKKYILITILMITVTMLLTGCGNRVADEAQIQTDLEAYTRTNIFDADEKIIEVTIDRRQTEKDAKQDTVWCIVRTEDEKCAYEKAMTLSYTLYDEGGWILDVVSVNGRSEWSITPIVGVDSEEIYASLNGISITADNEIWQVTQSNIKSISVDSQETNLETQTDVVTVTLTVDDIVEEASGQLDLNYTFDDHWVINSISGNENFTAAAKPGMAMNMTEEALLETFVGQSFTYGTGRFEQEISIGRDEVSNFAIVNQEASSRGTVQSYICSGTLTKPLAEFALNVEIQYYYSDEWYLKPVSIGAECTSVSIDGNWTGKMWNDSCELDITGIDTDGMVTGIFSYNEQYGQGKGSYYVSGKIDLSSLTINMEAGDEIIACVNYFGRPDDKYDVQVQVIVEGSTISGQARHTFKVAR